MLLGTAGVGALANLNLYVSAAAVMASAVAGPGAVRALASMSPGDQRRQWLQRWLFLGPLVVASGLTALGVLAADSIAHFLLGSDMALAVLIATAAIPMATAAFSYTQLLQALMRVRSLAKADIVTTVASLPLTAVTVAVWGLPGGVLSVASLFLVRLVALYAFEPHVAPRSRWLDGLRISRRQLGPVLAVGVGAAIVAIVTIIGPLVVRAEIVASLGLSASGLYQPVAALSESYLDVVIAATSVYLFPRLTELLANHQPEAAQQEFSHGLRLTLAVTTPMALIAIGFAEPIVHVFYSPEFTASAPPLAIQMAGTILKVVMVSASVALVPLGRTRTWVGIALAVAVGRVILVLLLAGPYQLVGVALASDIAWAAGALAAVVAIHRSTLVRLRLPEALMVLLAGALVILVVSARQYDAMLAAVSATALTGVWVLTMRRELHSLVTSLRP